MSRDRAEGSLGQRLSLFIGFGLWFCLVYGLCDFLAAGFAQRYDLGTPIDGWLPYVPWAANAYLLINLVLVAPVFVIPDRARFMAFYLTLALEVLVAGVIFLVFPVEPLPAPAIEAWSAMGLADLVNLTYNVFPSLHVALALSCGIGLSPHVSKAWKRVLWVVVTAIVLSTVLTKQHYVADVIGGAVLAIAAMRFAFPCFFRAPS